MGLLTDVLKEAEKVKTKEFQEKYTNFIPKVSEFKEKMQTLSWALEAYLIENYVKLTQSKSLAQLNFKIRSEQLVNDYRKLKVDIESLREYQIEDVNFETNCENLSQLYDHFVKLNTIIGCLISMAQAMNDFHRYKYTESLTLMEDTKKKLITVKVDGEIGLAIKQIRSVVNCKYSVCVGDLCSQWDEIFTWSEKNTKDHVVITLNVDQSDIMNIQKIVKSLHAIKKFNFEMIAFSDFFISKFVDNILKYNCDIFTDENMKTISFNLKINKHNLQKPKLQTLFMNLSTVFEFMLTTINIMDDNKNIFITTLSKLIAGKFFKKLQTELLEPMLSKCDQDKELSKNLNTELEIFLKFLIDINFSTSISPLSKFIKNFDDMVFENKCNQMLNYVKTLLETNLTHNIVFVGQSFQISSDVTLTNTTFCDSHLEILNKPLFMPKCAISDHVKKILSIILEKISEGNKFARRYYSQLLNCIKDIIVLYQTMVPRLYDTQLKTCPYEIAIFFNNSFYLAHGLIGTQQSIALNNETTLLTNITLIECVQDLRMIALDTIAQYLQEVQKFIRNTIQPTSSLILNYESQSAFEIQIDEIIYKLKLLKSNWYNILPNNMYEISMSMLVATLCQSVLGKLFNNGNKILMSDCVYALSCKMEYVVGEIVQLFEPCTNIQSLVTEWNKFTMLSYLLRAQMLEISKCWCDKTKGTLGDFTFEEIRHIIKLRFTDNAYRLKIIASIQ